MNRNRTELERERDAGPPAEADLVRRARAGETAAFGELVSIYMQRCYYAALGMVGSPQDAEDLSQEIQDEIRRQMKMMGLELGVVGLMNCQFALRGDDIYILEVNPRASRTVPFVSKATGRPLASVAALCMAGKTLEEQGYTEEIVPKFYSVKEAILPFLKFPGVDPILGP